MQLKSIISDTAAIAIAMGDLEYAVTVLEQGRGIIVTHLGQYRADVTGAKALAPELAKRVTDLQGEFERFFCTPRSIR